MLDCSDEKGRMLLAFMASFPILELQRISHSIVCKAEAVYNTTRAREPMLWRRNHLLCRDMFGTRLH